MYKTYILESYILSRMDLDLSESLALLLTYKLYWKTTKYITTFIRRSIPSPIWLGSRPGGGVKAVRPFTASKSCSWKSKQPPPLPPTTNTTENHHHDEHKNKKKSRCCNFDSKGHGKCLFIGSPAILRPWASQTWESERPPKFQGNTLVSEVFLVPPRHFHQIFSK